MHFVFNRVLFMAYAVSISKLRTASAPAVLQFARAPLPDFPGVDSFDPIPDSLLVDIFSFVYHLRDLHRCAVVAKRWNCIVRSAELGQTFAFSPFHLRIF